VTLYERGEVGDQPGASSAQEIKTMPRPSTTKPKRSKAEQRAESREQILDGAEYLFSERGLYGVTLKDVAQQVGVHTSLLHYYFDDKRGLFEAVVDRRASVTTERRMKAMDDYEREAGDNVTVEGALHAFLDTDLDLYFNGGEGLRNYAAMGSQIVNTVEGGEVFNEHFDRVVLRLIDLLKKAMPDAADQDIFWGYHFVNAGLMATVSRTRRIDRLSGGLCSLDDYAAVRARMAPFMAAGLIAICRERAAARSAGSAAPLPSPA
jgi:AcrR family transcriptional regulator